MDPLFFIVFTGIAVLLLTFWKALKSLRLGIFAPKVQLIVRAPNGKETIVHDEPTFVNRRCLLFFHESLASDHQILFPDHSEKSVVFMAATREGALVSTWIICGPMELLTSVRVTLDGYLSAKPLLALVQ